MALKVSHRQYSLVSEMIMTGTLSECKSGLTKMLGTGSFSFFSINYRVISNLNSREILFSSSKIGWRNII